MAAAGCKADLAVGLANTIDARLTCVAFVVARAAVVGVGVNVGFASIEGGAIAVAPHLLAADIFITDVG